MHHRLFTLRVATVVLTLAVSDPGRGQQPTSGADDWKYDIVYRRKGEPFKGLILEQNDRHVDMIVLVRKPGRPTLQFKEDVPRKDVDRVEMLDPKDRDVLQKRVKALRREYDLLRARTKLLDPGAKPPTDDVELPTLKPMPWPPEPGHNALSYQSTHFRLISTSSETFTQLAAIDLEHFYSCYTGMLPPRTNAQPTTILLTGTLAEYQALLQKHDANFLNPAFFDAARNQVICGSDYQRLFDQMTKMIESNAKRRKELAQTEADLKIAYKGKQILPDLLAQIEQERNHIDAAAKRNWDGFHQQNRRLFRRLYHEAFHAYLNTFVYPPEEGEMPRWFNEGLAQIFEAGIFEVDGLRIDHAEPEQVDALRKALTNDTLPSVADLLKSGPKQFLVAHTSEKQMADRFYIASWGLAHYLTFGRQVLGTKAMDEYVRSLKRGTDPVEAFTTLVDHAAAGVPERLPPVSQPTPVR